MSWLDNQIKKAETRAKLYQYISDLGAEECLNRIEGRFSQDSINDIRKRRDIHIDLLLKEVGSDLDEMLLEKGKEDAENKNKIKL